MDYYRLLAELTDSEVALMLTALMQSEAEANDSVDAILNGTPEQPVVLDVEGEVEEFLHQREGDPRQQARALRQIAIEMGDVPELPARIEGWAKDRRPVLFEPITTCLIAACIVFMLETKYRAKVEYDREHGLRFNVKADRNRTSPEVIKRIFRFGLPGGDHS